MASNYDVSEEQRKLLEDRHRRRIVLRNEFLKQTLNPHAHGHGGTVFDPAMQRWFSARVSTFEHFRANAKSTRYGLLYLVIPMGLTMYLFKTTKDKQEASYRNGEVAYADRRFKFI